MINQKSKRNYNQVSPISRKIVTLTCKEKEARPVQCLQACTVLILNNSHEMAKEITLQLTYKFPNASLLYAPTIEIARLILSRKQFDLVVASPILPDGSAVKLQEILQSLAHRPDLVVVGKPDNQIGELFLNKGYEINSLRPIGNTPTRSPGLHKPVQPRIASKARIATLVSSLGADLRNDLNNPLQEIVAMVFVARSSQTSGISEMTQEALAAIDSAAQNLAGVVQGLENKIKEVLVSNA